MKVFGVRFYYIKRIGNGDVFMFGRRPIGDKAEKCSFPLVGERASFGIGSIQL